MRFIT